MLIPSLQLDKQKIRSKTALSQASMGTAFIKEEEILFHLLN